DGFSPEHGPEEDGVSFDQQLAWDLLSNFIEGSEVLGVDGDKRTKARSMRDHLLGPQIGEWGQLQEWMVDRDNPKDQHRHLSHMIAVHPGRQISPLTTPDLAQAARVSMNARGDGATGWSKAWKINIWARLHDGDRAYTLIRNLIAGGGIVNNLFDTHPPFQIDGNFGYASGVCEMLIQSHMGAIHLLPALPSAWPNGHVRGMRARGGYSIGMEWKEGRLARAVIRAEQGGTCRVRISGGGDYKVNGASVTRKDGVMVFETERGREYTIESK
ncbi:MAG: glycoside hydrolase family 95 protein, partial [Planctomycetes bacterium]|nr:glycoside hydrolase family 95 protein [Planctomycetota bacterium]